jgi:hypothetical protein
VSANTRLDSLSDLIKHKANLQVDWPCGRRHVFDAQRLNRYASLRGWNSQLFTMRAYLKCRCCRAMPDRLRATPEPPTPDDPFPRDERGWTALHRRMRG